MAETAPQTIGAWLHIAEDGAVTVFTGKVEVGQGIRTSLGQVVAEELRLPPSAVHLVMADTHLTPYDPGTFGSRTTPDMVPRLRRAATAARELLLDLAAERWEANRVDLLVTDGKIIHPETGESLTFGELTHGQPLTQSIPDDVPTTPPEQWTVVGRSAPKVHAQAVVTGAHRYTSDMQRPSMLYGKMLRPPAFGATLASVDTQQAEALPGVTVVREGDAGGNPFVGVAAPSEHSAARAIAAVGAEWTPPPPQPSYRELFTHLKTRLEKGPEAQRYAGRDRYECGSLEEGFAAADASLVQTYTAAYIAHAPLEPRAAVAEWSDSEDGPRAAAQAPVADALTQPSRGKGVVLTVWTGTQRPFGVRKELAETFGLPEARVRVIVPDTGSGYGGKHSGDAAIEAARLARAVGKPVKVVWTREEEFTWAYFRPAGVVDITSGARADGALLAWDYHVYNAGPAAMRTPYEVPHQVIAFHAAHAPLRQGSYRALAATANHFARETHMDELAHALGLDPLAFRLRNIQDLRLRAVLEAAVECFGSPKTASGRGFGLACGTEKGSYVATCAEVAVDPTTRQLRVVRVVEAFECGAVISPDQLRSQVEGAIVQGMGGALFEAIEFGDGKILNPRFSCYRVPRFADAPAIETVLLDRRDLPSVGGGETPIVGIAPALGNAIFDATGVRLRSLPLAPNGLG